MRPEPATDPLELWRSVDDAVWREAFRAEPPLLILWPLPARRSDRPDTAPAPQPVAQKVPEPA